MTMSMHGGTTQQQRSSQAEYERGIPRTLEASTNVWMSAKLSKGHWQVSEVQWPQESRR